MKDLDTFHKDRIKAASKRFGKGGFSLTELFVSERVAQTLSRQKLYLSSYRHDDLLAMLPFSETVLVAVCPACVDKTNFEKFKRLVERQAFIPVLIAPYNMYPEPVAEIAAAHDHISRYEFYYYRELVLGTITERGLCRHCVERKIEGSLDLVRNRKDFEKFKDAISWIRSDLAPFLAPDYELLNAMTIACEKKSMRQLKQVKDISDGVYAVRTAQAFNAPVLLRIDEMEKLPTGIIREQDESSSVQAEMKKFAAEGLGLRVPTEIDAEEYLDLLSDFRPSIARILHQVVEGDDQRPSAVTMFDVQKEVVRINAEIERISNLRRTVVLEACVGFYRDHPKLVTTSLIMSALGLAGSMWGCVTTLGVQATRGATQAIRGKKSTPEVARLKSTIARDLRPLVDRLIAAYVGTEVSTVGVLSLRRALENRLDKKPSTRKIKAAA